MRPAGVSTGFGRARELAWGFRFTFFPVAALLACGGEPETPEARIRALVERAELAAEARDPAAVVGLLSDRYADAHGGDRDAARALLFHLFLPNESVHLRVRVHDLRLGAPGHAELTAFVAMAGSPIEGVAALAELRADVYRFDLALEEEAGAWRVVGAAWRPARPADLAD